MSSHRESDPRTRDLLEGYLGGNREDERELFELHRQKLLERVRREHWMAGLARYLTPEDLVGEVFVRALGSGALRDLDDRGRGSLARLLFKMLDDAAVDTYRRHGAEKRGGGRLPDSYDVSDEGAATGQRRPQVASPDTTPTQKVRAGELLERCRGVLDDREWEVWHLSEVESCDSLEIAQRVGSTDSAVRGVLHRARHKLLMRLAQVVHADPDLGTGDGVSKRQGETAIPQTLKD